MPRKIGLWLVVVFLLGASRAFPQGEIKKVSKNDALSAVTAKTQPVYPPVARQMRVEGIVELEAVISEEGKVEKVNILSGNPMLTHPAADALKSWHFKAFTNEDGKPVKVLAPVSFTFSLTRGD